MGYNELDVLHFQAMTATITAFKAPQLEGLTLFPEVQIPGGGIEAKWDIIEPSRNIGTRYRLPTEPATSVDLMIVKKKTATCLLMNLKKRIDEGVLAWLRQIGTQQEVNARATITREQSDLNAIIDYTKELAIWKALSGTYTPTVGGSTISIDYEIPAGHKPTAGITWATATTDIISDIGAWKKLIEQDSGFTPRHAYCNQSVMNYLMKNTGLKDLLGQATVREQVARTGQIQEALGLLWHVNNSGYLDSSGTFVNFIPDDIVILLPDEKVYGYLQTGSQAVPTGNGNDIATVLGKFSYFDIGKDPVEYLLYVGQNFLPVIPIPKAIVYADTTI